MIEVKTPILYSFVAFLEVLLNSNQPTILAVIAMSRTVPICRRWLAHR